MEYTLIIVVLVGLLWIVFLVLAEEPQRRYYRAHTPQIVHCPKLNAPAVLELAAGSALEVKRCSRWPECAPCTQACLAQAGGAAANRNPSLRIVKSAKRALANECTG
jgi:hypothetical protein